MRLRVITILALLVGAILLVRMLRPGPPARTPEVTTSDTESPREAASSFRKAIHSLSAPDGAEPAATVSTGTGSNRFQRIASGEIDLQLTSEQMAEYLRRFGTNVETLLATQSRENLKLAAELFPNDPRVQYAVITRDIFPEDKRDWLEKFKQSAPDNPIANYLSAREYLKAGDRERGLQDLTAAAGKTRFDDYTMERWQAAEDAQLSAGRPVAEAKIAAGSSLMLPQLAQFKNLAQEMQKLQKEYVSAGDLASAQTLAGIGHTLAQQLSQGEGSRPLINQLVGAAIDRIALSPLPQDSQPDFLGQTIQQRFDEAAAFKSDVRSLTPLADEMMARGDEGEIISYFDRLKIQGEYKALLWLRNKNQFR
jgi:hypothetical protein